MERSPRDWDVDDPLGLLSGQDATDSFAPPAMMPGSLTPPFFDTDGKRAMGYYNGNDLNYYYFMASNFATSDRWFHPVMTRTHPNREYLCAATSQGDVYKVGTNSADSQPLTATDHLPGAAEQRHQLENLRQPSP